MKKHRTGADKKISVNHHLIDGLREAAEEMAVWPEITAINPGRIYRKGGASHRGGRFGLRPQVDTITGLKCRASYGGTVQEVFLVTSSPNEVRQRIEIMWPETR